MIGFAKSNSCPLRSALRGCERIICAVPKHDASTRIIKNWRACARASCALRPFLAGADGTRLSFEAVNALVPRLTKMSAPRPDQR
jgi:hypothetical protein